MRTRQRVHQRRLASPVAANQADDLTRVEVDRHVVDCVDAAERHADVTQLDERRARAIGLGGDSRCVGHVRHLSIKAGRTE